MLADRVELFMRDFKTLRIGEVCGLAYNERYTAPMAIRPETIDKIKKLIHDDLMFTCEETEFGLAQKYMRTGEW